MVKPWSIIGAGPVGSMQAVLFATIFPGQEVYVFDQRDTHQRNHGLQIRNATIDDINAQLDAVTNELKRRDSSVYNQLILKNIIATQAFLTESFKSFSGGQFVRTKTISNKLQKFAEEMGARNAQELGLGTVNFLMGKDYAVTSLQLDNLQNEVSIEDSNTTKVEKILRTSSMIFGADGSHSKVRERIFKDPEPEKEVIQYLVEIKLDMKSNATESSGSSSMQSSSEFFNASTDLIGRSVLPTLRSGKLHVWTVGKEGTATLHILVKKEVYDTLLANSNLKGKLGMPGNPYTRLRQLPISNGVRALVTGAISDTIGLKNIQPESIKITTIPMHVYIAKSLTDVVNKTFYALVGDAAVGLIFIRGVNNGLQSTAAYTSTLFQLFKDKSAQEIAQYQFISQVPQEFKECELLIREMFQQKVHDIKSEQALIDMITSSIESSGAISSIFSSWNEEQNYEADQLVPRTALRNLLHDLDNELDKIQLVIDEEGNELHPEYKPYRASLPALDLLANRLDEEICNIEKTAMSEHDDERFLNSLLNHSCVLIRSLLDVTDKAQQKALVLEFKKQVAALSNANNASSDLVGIIGQTARTLLNGFMSSLSSSKYSFSNKKAAITQAVLTVADEVDATLSV
ncbi:MAG: hypothetical protein WC627_10010 [Legionella sp.]|jgi:2-polyprenyl-6-methoxyphenol hydroxylase-like FAD-dependent oxidoreductase